MSMSVVCYILASKLSVAMVVEGCFSCGKGRGFAIVKCTSCMWLCVPWARWLQCLCSNAQSMSRCCNFIH